MKSPILRLPIRITVRPAGMPAEQHTGVFPSTSDAALFALDLLGNRAGSITTKVLR